jgi:hypothetical protein
MNSGELRFKPFSENSAYCLLWRIYNRVESLQSHYIHTMSHWSSGLPVCFPSWGTRVQSPGGYLCETGILLLALSRYMVTPTWCNHWFRCPSVGASFRLRTDNVKSQRLRRPSVGASLGFAPTMCKPTWSHTALLSWFHTVCRSSFRLHNWQSRLRGGGGSPVESRQ